MTVGPTTKKIAFKETDNVYQRWCVEVHYQKDGKDQMAAVVVQQVAPSDDYDSWDWDEPQFNKDCSGYK